MPDKKCNYYFFMFEHNFLQNFNVSFGIIIKYVNLTIFELFFIISSALYASIFIPRKQ